MPSQIVFFPPDVFASIVNHGNFHRDMQFGLREMLAPGVVSTEGVKSIRVLADQIVYCPERSALLGDDIYALLLCPSQPKTAIVPPDPLPAALVTHLLKECQAALLGLPRLTGHDIVEVAAAIDEALGSSATYPRPRRRPAAGSPAERHLDQAAQLQKQMRGALNKLDRKLASYAAEVRKHSLEVAVVRLGLQAELGAMLQLDLVEGGSLPSLTGAHRRGRFQELWQSTQNALAALQSGLDAINRTRPTGISWLADDPLLPLHSTLLRDLVHPTRCGRLRSPLMKIRSAEGMHSPALSAEEVPQAIEAFTQAFDADFWRDLHPLLRAGLGHLAFEGIHPFGDGNGRLGRLLMQLMLIEDGMPGTPLEAVLAWNRNAYLECVDAAIRSGDVEGFIAFLLRAVDWSISLGRYFIRELKPLRRPLLQSFADVGSRRAGIMAEYGVSMVLGPDRQMLQRLIGTDNLGRFLSDAGFDPVFCEGSNINGDRTSLSYSCPAARVLLVAPPARM